MSKATIKRPAPALQPLLTTAELASFLGCSRRTIEKLKARGDLPAPDVLVGRMPRWRRETIEEWIDAQSSR